MNHPLYNFSNNQKTLGKGLGALIPGKEQKKSEERGTMAPVNYFSKMSAGSANQIIHVAPAQIKPNPYQPRKNFSREDLDSLKLSIKNYGILQPLLVTRTLGGGYELVAGERRLRAATELGLSEVPIIVRTTKDLEKLELSLVENIQREDLNPIEKARAYKQLMDDFNLTQEEAAKRIGIARSTFGNVLRLLNLPGEIQMAVVGGKISEGQAKAMLGVEKGEQQIKIMQKVQNDNLTVDEIERAARQIRVKAHKRNIKKDSQTENWEREMQRALGTRVTIRRRGQSGGGVVEIEFYSEEELRGIAQKITE